MVDPAKIARKLLLIEQNVASLREIGARWSEPPGERELDFHASLRLLQVAIEAMLDVANHIAAQERWGMPQTYREALEELVAHGVLTGRRETYGAWARFRNRLVHLYEDVAPAVVHALVRDRLGDFEDFIRDVLAYLERRGAAPRGSGAGAVGPHEEGGAGPAGPA